MWWEAHCGLRGGDNGTTPRRQQSSFVPCVVPARCTEALCRAVEDPSAPTTTALPNVRALAQATQGWSRHEWQQAAAHLHVHACGEQTPKARARWLVAALARELQTRGTLEHVVARPQQQNH